MVFFNTKNYDVLKVISETSSRRAGNILKQMAG